MRRHRARTSRLRHRLPAHEIILFRLLPRSSLARRRLALDTARIPRAPRRSRAALSPLSPRIAPLDCGAAAIGEIDQDYSPPFRARGVATRRDRRTGDMARANSALARFDSFPRRLSRPLSTSRARRRTDVRTETRKNSLASLNPRETSRRSRARVRRRTRDVRERTVGFRGPTDALLIRSCDPSSPRDDARGERRTAIDAKNSSTFLARERARRDSVTTESVTNR